MNKEKTLFKLKNVSFDYIIGKQKITALKDVNLCIPMHKLVTISGPSGSGKSTLLNLLGLIEPLQLGEIFFLQEPFSNMMEKRKNEIRKLNIGFIFQQFHLIPVLTAKENVSYFLNRQKNLSKEELQERVFDALTAVELWEHRFKKPGEMSGGQKQRVAIARALAKNPHVIIGDEPTGSLDQKTAKGIMEIFASIVEQKKMSIILSTHDPMVQSFSCKNYHFHDGQLV